MHEFYVMLMSQVEAKIVPCNWNFFNHQINIDVDNCLTVYGICELGTESPPITMLVAAKVDETALLRMERGERQRGCIL